MTTKDMPVVQPPSFKSLHLMGFQISPHYLDPDPHTTHMGETQEERILQFLEKNDRTVIGVREGSFIHCDQRSAVLDGRTRRACFVAGTLRQPRNFGTILAAANAEPDPVQRPELAMSWCHGADMPGRAPSNSGRRVHGSGR
jgi:hypothetical protein